LEKDSPVADMKSKQTPRALTGRLGHGFDAYDPELFDLIVLHRWSDKARKQGRDIGIGKAPIHAGWSTMAVDSRRTRTRCLREGRNMGVRLKNTQLIIDVDPRNGGDLAFLLLCADLGLNDDEWPRVLTGSGGWHCYMALPPDFAVKETLEGDVYAGLEFKSVGRQVVAAGSRHPNGKCYRWSVRHPSITAGLPMIPSPLRELIRRRQHQFGANTETGVYSVDLLKTMLARLPVREFSDYETWLRLLFACHHATAGHGEDVFVRWSASDPDYAGHEEQISQHWRRCKNKVNAITYRTLNYFLRQHGANDLVPPNAVPKSDFPPIAPRRTLRKVTPPKVIGRVRTRK
jgi:hypothetical protein